MTKHRCKNERCNCVSLCCVRGPGLRFSFHSQTDSCAESLAAEYLKIHPDVDAERLAFTLNHCRSQLEWREAVSAVTPSELADILSSSSSNHTKACDNPRIGFVFTGQGAQWATMGTGLLVYPIFRGTLHEADMRLRSMGASWSLMGELPLSTSPSATN